MASTSIKLLSNSDNSQSTPNCSKNEQVIPDIEPLSYFDADDHSSSCTKRKRSSFKPKSYVENLFKGVDDLLASYSKYTCTPEPLSKIRQSNADLEVFHNTPKLTPYPYVSQIERSERREAYLREQRDYEAKVLHKNITPRKIDMPFNKSISGISLSPTALSPSTPFSTKFPHLPESVKKTILLGVTCYVDVRIGKENRSNCVKRELELIGAKVQRTLTKKVDVIVFREGAVSTYFKAKELGISMVSTFWIEASKEMQKKVDPELYPAQNMKKYEDILPYEAIKKRRFRIPKEFKEKYDINSLRSAIKSNKKRNAVTDAKHRTEKSNLGDSSKNKLCSKKLDFDNENSHDSINETIEKDVPRRVSASASIGRRHIGQKRLFQSNLNKEINEGKTTRDSISCSVASKKPATIVFTSFRESEVLECERIIQKLGVFEIESNVSKRTTHIISNGPRRTINLLKGLVRGCWILDAKWLYKSDLANTYIEEDEFELTLFSSAVMQNRLKRHALKDDYHMDLFSSCGPIYVSQQCVPPNADLTELVKLCQGKIAANSSAAEIIIGGHRKNNSAFRVKENWVLDSITQNKLLDINDFKY